jgi:hypothetical protein
VVAVSKPDRACQMCPAAERRCITRVSAPPHPFIVIEVAAPVPTEVIAATVTV